MPWISHLAVREPKGSTQTNEWNLLQQASVSLARNKDILVVIAPRNLLNVHVPMHALVPLPKSRKFKAKMKSQLKEEAGKRITPLPK